MIRPTNSRRLSSSRRWAKASTLAGRRERARERERERKRERGREGGGQSERERESAREQESKRVRARERDSESTRKRASEERDWSTSCCLFNHLQEYLAHKHPPLVGPYSIPLPGTYGDPREIGLSYERGTPVVVTGSRLGGTWGSHGGRVLQGYLAHKTQQLPPGRP